MSNHSRNVRDRETREEDEVRESRRRDSSSSRGIDSDVAVRRSRKRARNSRSRSSSPRSGKPDRSSSSNSSSRSRSRDGTTSSSSSLSTSSSDSDAAPVRKKKAKRMRREEAELRERREKREKKKKKQKKLERKKRRDGEKRKGKEDEVKTKHHKKEKKKKRKKDFYSSKSATDQYGKYGLLNESDMWKKRPEFFLWLTEVKGKNIESLPAWEEKELFKDYLEDFNTATLPSEKYYNLELYEAKQRMKRVNLQEHRELTDFNDEARRRNEILALREQRRAAEAQQRLQVMRDERDKVQDMRQQQLLKSKVETLYRLGANAEAKKLAESLQPAK